MKPERNRDRTRAEARLVLRLETVRVLSTKQLSRVVGGVDDAPSGCGWPTTETKPPEGHGG